MSVNRDRDEVLKWLRFIGRRILEFTCLTAWLIMAWTVDEYVMPKFPVHGISRVMLYIAERAFFVSTLYELLRLLFWPRRRRQPRDWWR